MARVRRRHPWHLPEAEAVAEETYLDRRAFLTRAGRLALTASLIPLGAPTARATPDPTATSYFRGPLETIEPGSPNSDLYPAARAPKYTLDRPLTDEMVAATSNNFYEFSTTKGQVWRHVERFKTRPWTLEVTGDVERPATFDVDALARRVGLEERLYRLRCVEAWSIAVPWTGFELRKLLDIVRPTSSARYVRFVGFLDAEVAPGQKDNYFPWPYYEALTIEEATHELVVLATGIYGHELPKQHGAPIRLVVPWKYGFKSIKSIRRIELTSDRPRTFWSDTVPSEYDFTANVLPNTGHPRWSQATETVLGSGEIRPTLPYNGYGELVAGLYPEERSSGNRPSDVRRLS